eukprot:gb/GECG01002666.1/.p1 GENE.gb/GECG01002666.1/~~gb/GECG01002666.1/.p1  ORF type:complete len:738 (+),score=120.87 gb/GECG01002666.1/:1-2214(+)
METHREDKDNEGVAKEEGFPISEDMILDAWAQNEPYRHRARGHPSPPRQHGATAPISSALPDQSSAEWTTEDDGEGKNQEHEPRSETNTARGPRFPESTQKAQPLSSSAMQYSVAVTQSNQRTYDRSIHSGVQDYQPSNYAQHNTNTFEGGRSMLDDASFRGREQYANNIAAAEASQFTVTRENMSETKFQVQQPDWNRLMDKLQSVLQHEFDHRSQATWELHQNTISELTHHYETQLSSWKEQCSALEKEDGSLKVELQQWTRIAERLATTRGLMKRKNELWYGKQGVLAIFRAWASVSRESKEMRRKFERAEKHHNKTLQRKCYSEWCRHAHAMARQNLESEWQMKLQQATSRADHEASVRVSEMQQRVLETECARDKAVKMVQHLRGQLQTLLKRGLSAMSEEADELLYQWGVSSSYLDSTGGESKDQYSITEPKIDIGSFASSIDANEAVNGLYARSFASANERTQSRPVEKVPPSQAGSLQEFDTEFANAAADSLKRVNANSGAQGDGGFYRATNSSSETHLDAVPEQWDTNMSMDSGGPLGHPNEDLRIHSTQDADEEDDAPGSATKAVWKRLDGVSTPAGQPPSTVATEESVVLRNDRQSTSSYDDGESCRQTGKTVGSKLNKRKGVPKKPVSKGSANTRKSAEADKGSAKPVMHPSGSTRSVRLDVRRHASKNNVRKTADASPAESIPKRTPPEPHGRQQQQFNPARQGQRVAVYKHSTSPYRSSSYGG